MKRTFTLKLIVVALFLCFNLIAQAQSFSENFDNIANLTAQGWSTHNSSVPLGTTGWFQGDSTAFHSFNGSLANSYIAADLHNTTSQNTISNWLFAPTRVLRNGDTISFYTQTEPFDIAPDRLQVRMSTNGASTNVGSGSSAVGDFTNLLLDINPTLTPGIAAYPLVWTQYTIVIHGLSAPISGRIAFRYFVTLGGPAGINSQYIGIDKFEYKTYNCPALSISPTSLSNAPAGVAFNQIFTETGVLGLSLNPAPTYSISNGALPLGTTLSNNGTINNNGILSGTPTVTNTYNFTIDLTDASGCNVSQALSWNVVCPTITINQTSLSNGTVGAFYSQSLTQTGAVGTTNYTVSSGALPNGISLSSAGVISGTCTAAGSFTFTVNVTDQNACTGQKGFSIVTSCPTTVINQAGLPNGTVGAFYSQALTETGLLGSAITYTVTNGSLPNGLSLSSSGVLSGTVTTAGAFPFAVKVSDEYGCNALQSYTVTTSCPSITINQSSLPNGTVGALYSQSLTQTGLLGNAITFTLITGSLPNGLSLSSSGVLSGTVTTAGAFPFAVEVSDEYGCNALQSYTVTTSCPSITINQTTLPNATVGDLYSQTLTQTGDLGQVIIFDNISGALPDGLSLSSSGVISGTCTASGSFPFTIEVSDEYGCGAQQTFTISVFCPTITLSPAVLPVGIVGQSYSEALSQTGAVGSFIFNLATGSLPEGISLGSNGTIFGVTMFSGNYNIVTKVIDQYGCTGQQSYTLTIGCPLVSSSFSYSSASYCSNESNPLPIFNAGATAGTFTSLPFGLEFTGLNAGEIDLTSSVSGNYAVINTIVGQGNCSNVADTVFVQLHSGVTADAGTNQVVCDSSETVFNGIGSGGTGSLTYTWTNGVDIYNNDSFTIYPESNMTYSLTVADAVGCSATSTVSVSIINNTDIYGLVTYSGGIVNNAVAVLYKYEDPFKLYDRVRTLFVGADGYYHFPNVVNHEYLVKIFPTASSPPSLLKTYYGNTYMWDSAVVINHTCSSIDTFNITMREFSNPGGIGKLTGYVYAVDGFGRNIESDPVPGVDVKVGRNPSGALVTNTSTNSIGYYELGNLPFDDYIIYVDIPGLDHTITYSVTVNASNPQIDNLDFCADSVAVPACNLSIGINNQLLNVTNFNFFPNPFSDVATIEYVLNAESMVNVEVYDVLGNRITALVNNRQVKGKNSVALNSTELGLNAGVYFITLTINDKKETHKVVLMK